MVEKEEYSEERKQLMKDLEKIESNDGTSEFGKRSTQNKSGYPLTDKQNDITKTQNYLYKTEENKEKKNEDKERKLNQTEKKSEINENYKNATHHPVIIGPISSKVLSNKNIQKKEESNYEEKNSDFQNESKTKSLEDPKEDCNIKGSSLTIQNGDHINNPQINDKEKSKSNSDDNQNINNIQNSKVNEDAKSMSISNEIQNNENNPENHEGNGNCSSEEGDPMSLSGENQNENNQNNLLNNNDMNGMQSDDLIGLNYNDINNEFDNTNQNTDECNNENTGNYPINSDLSNLSGFYYYMNWVDDPQNKISGSGFHGVNSNREK